MDLSDTKRAEDSRPMTDKESLLPETDEELVKNKQNPKVNNRSEDIATITPQQDQAA